MSTEYPSSSSFPWFQLFKYTIYILLTYNVFLFFQEEILASEHLFTNGVQLSQLIQAFAATIDTAAWVVLLLLFELETYVLDDEKIKGITKHALHGTRALAYIVIVYAFYGYVVKCFGLYDFSPSSITDLCSLATNNFSFMTDLDEFSSLSLENCQAIASAPQLMELTGTTIITDTETLLSTKLLAWTDIINAGNWLLILVILEIDVRLQLKGKPSASMLSINKMAKVVLYTILVGAAAYWGVAGDFVDFWDALLWILAFAFIELNIFEWQAETAAKNDSTL